MATIATAWLEKLGMLMTLTIRPTTEIPVAMPNRAVMIGRPMASTEPKATRRMITAARRPTPSLANSGGSAKMSPPSSISVPGTSASSTRSTCRLAGIGELLAVTIGEVDGGEGDVPGVRAALGDLALALLAVGAGDLRVGDLLGHLGEELLHARLDLGLVHATVGLEHDLAGEARLVAEALLLQEVEAVLALRAGQLELVAELTAHRLVETEQADEQDHPRDQHQLSVVVAGSGEATHRGEPPSTERGQPDADSAGRSNDVSARPDSSLGRAHPQVRALAGATTGAAAGRSAVVEPGARPAPRGAPATPRR